MQMNQLQRQMYLTPQMSHGTGFSACNHEGLSDHTQEKCEHTQAWWALHRQQALFSTLCFDAICVSWLLATMTK